MFFRALVFLHSCIYLVCYVCPHLARSFVLRHIAPCWGAVVVMIFPVLLTSQVRSCRSTSNLVFLSISFVAWEIVVSENNTFCLEIHYRIIQMRFFHRVVKKHRCWRLIMWPGMFNIVSVSNKKTDFAGVTSFWPTDIFNLEPLVKKRVQARLLSALPVSRWCCQRVVTRSTRETNIKVPRLTRIIYTFTVAGVFLQESAVKSLAEMHG